MMVEWVMGSEEGSEESGGSCERTREAQRLVDGASRASLASSFVRGDSLGRAYIEENIACVWSGAKCVASGFLRR